MITYKHKNYVYFFDSSAKSWTVYEINEKGYQISDTEYFGNKKSLKKNYPNFKFIKTNY
tara:strand:+ start:509 stop:685 length:177 start_codon:yes stop_codon:yes gene_type:complete